MFIGDSGSNSSALSLDVHGIYRCNKSCIKARVVRRCDDIEREAAAKAQCQVKSQTVALEKELKAAKKVQEEADKKCREAEEARIAAELERDQLTEEQIESANDLMDEL